MDAAASLPGSPLDFTRGGGPSASLRPSLAAARAQVQTIMWQHAGILRTDQGLSEGLEKMRRLSSEVASIVGCEGGGGGRGAGRGPTSESAGGESVGVGACGCMAEAELVNMLTVGELILQSAMRRRESRGLHFNADHPKHRQKFSSRVFVFEAPAMGEVRAKEERRVGSKSSK